MIKKITCMLIIIIAVFCSVNVFNNNVYAVNTLDNVVSGAKDFLNQGTENTINETKLKSVSDFIYNAALAIALVLAVIIGMIIGIQYMMGSIEEKAKYKEALMPYVLGCFVVFGSLGIWKLIILVLSEW